MQKLYSQFTEQIRNDLRYGSKRGDKTQLFSKSSNFSDFNGRAGTISGVPLNERLYKSLDPLNKISNVKERINQQPGLHPDFAYLADSGGEENHYITSMFIDISRSTGLFRKYRPLTVKNITSTIQNAALFTCWHFGGYIQRFHGDGLLIYFGGREITPSRSVQNAIDAASFFTYFVKNDLKNLFLEQGVENIYTRIGIDIGDHEDVLWYKAGIETCSEVTTCSLHTSLAAHMQGNAPGNGVMVGDYVKSHLSLSSDLYSIKMKADGSEDRYIFGIPEENFNYTQWVFNWERHLKNHPAVSIDSQGNLYLNPLAPAIISNESKNVDYLKKQVEGYKPYKNG